MHLDAETTQRFIDGELSPHRHTAALEHLGACAACREEIEATRRLDNRARSLIDTMSVPDPAVTVSDIRRAAARGRGAGWRWAAAIALTVAGATAAYAAYRAPGGGAAIGEDPPVASEGPSSPESPTGGGASGITVEAVRSIHIQTLGSGGALTVVLHGGTGITIRSSQPGTAFDAEVDRVTVRWDSAGANQIALEVPRDAPSVEVRVGSRLVWTWADGRVTTVMEEVDEGAYRLPGGS